MDSTEKSFFFFDTSFLPSRTVSSSGPHSIFLAELYYNYFWWYWVPATDYALLSAGPVSYLSLQLHCWASGLVHNRPTNICGMNECSNNIDAQTLVLMKNNSPTINQLIALTSSRRAEVKSFQGYFLPQVFKGAHFKWKKGLKLNGNVPWWLMRINLTSKPR